MKPENRCFTRNKTGLKYFIALCTGFAALASIPPSILAQELEGTTVTGRPIMGDSRVTASQHLSALAAVEGEKMARTSDIVDILNDNPALLCPLASTNSIDAIDAIEKGAENPGVGSDAGYTLHLRGLEIACATRVTNES